MAAHPLDSPTLSPGGETTAHGQDHFARVPAFTILWHPDTRRIGECSLGPARGTDVSRVEPLFHPRASSKPDRGTPLGDPYISSRSPSFTFRPAGEGFELVPGPADAHVKVDGQRLAVPTPLTIGDVERGVIITVARRVVLCLHLARPTRYAARRDHGLIGDSDGMDDVRREIDQVADLDVPVLLRGETGTGKGKAAAALVAASTRANRPSLSINMGATVPSTAASELFGHERGSFTGATATKLGLFAAADTGSLFLDEIGLTPADVQPMLLQVLDAGEIRPIGSNVSRRVDVRFIAGTDTDLERAISDGAFSEALFQRVARYPIMMPPLRDRREDFGSLFTYFLRTAFEKYGEPNRLADRPADAQPWLSASAVSALAMHHWAGNVRQLENVAGQLVVFNRGKETADLPPSVQSLLAAGRPPSAGPITESARDSAPTRISDEQVADALARSNGNASRAAAVLKVSRTTFYELRKRNPLLRSVNAIPDDELVACHGQCAGDVELMAQRLRVPVKALKDRLAHLPRPPGTS